MSKDSIIIKSEFFRSVVPCWVFVGFLSSSDDKESTCNAGDPLDSWVRKIPWRRDRLPIPVFLGFPGGSDGKESTCNVGDLSSISRLGRSPGEGKGYPLQYSCLENPHGQRSLAGYSPWDHKESDTTERLNTHAHARLGICASVIHERAFWGPSFSERK